MILGIAWPDVAIGVILAFGLLIGWFQGFIKQLSGVLALFIGFFAAFHYTGAADPWLMDTFHLGSGSARAIALIACFAFFYLFTIAVGFVLNRIARFPGLNVVNGALGALLGIVKAGIFVWFILLVALLFPLSPDLRRDLRSAPLARMLTVPNVGLDEDARRALPWITQPFAKGYFKRDRLEK